MGLSEDDLRIIDSLVAIRGRPEMYLRGGVASAADLARRVADDAKLLGAQSVEVEELADWWLIGGDRDWCKLGRDRPTNPLELFRRAWPFIEAGDNSMRSEILIAAFAKDVFTVSQGILEIVQGAGPEDELLEKVATGRWTRVIGFRLPPPAGASSATR